MFYELCNRDSSLDNQNKVQRYIELDNVGHCPNHEAPQIVGQVVSRWVNTEQRGKDGVDLIDGEVQLIPEPWGNISAREILEGSMQLSGRDKFLTSLVG